MATVVAPDVAGFVNDVVRPNAAAMAIGDGPDPREIVRAAAAHGIAGMLIPNEYGGSGSTHEEFADAVEQIARVCASTSVIMDVHISVAAEPIVLFGTDAQKRQHLPRLASGECVGGFALTEPGSGSDAAALVARADSDETGFRLTGTKAFITNCGAAGLYIVMARTGEGARGITSFLVDAAQRGVAAGEPLHKMGLRGSYTAELILDNVEVASDQVLGDIGGGFTVAMSALDSGRIGISAQAVGIAQGCLDAMVAHAKTVPDPDETALADIASRVAASRRLCRDAAATLDAGQPVTLLASAAKLYSTDTCVAAAHAAVEFCAPDSGLDSHPAAIRLRDAKACQIYEGTNQIQRVVIARHILRG